MFYLSKWISKKIIKKNIHQNITSLLAAVLLTPIVMYGLFYLFIAFLFYTPSYDFSSERWNTKKEKRFQMADDIIKSKMLIGKDSVQVVDILGNTVESRTDTLHQRIWTYPLGQGGGGLGFLFHYLQVSFKENKVVQVQHVEWED
jgi:hypothetical protein